MCWVATTEMPDRLPPALPERLLDRLLDSLAAGDRSPLSWKGIQIPGHKLPTCRGLVEARPVISPPTARDAVSAEVDVDNIGRAQAHRVSLNGPGQTHERSSASWPLRPFCMM